VTGATECQRELHATSLLGCFRRYFSYDRLRPADFDDDVRDRLQCEPSVQSIEHNAVVGVLPAALSSASATNPKR
jgi:hypothetical protein